MRYLWCFSTLIVFCCLSYDVSSETLGVRGPEEGCNGNIQLSSTEHEQIISFNPSDVAKEKRKKVKVISTDEESGMNLKFGVATSTGNCCWKAFKRVRGGRSIPLSPANTYQPGWAIKSIGLDDCATQGFVDTADAGTSIIVVASVCVVIGVIVVSIIIYRKKRKTTNTNGSTESVSEQSAMKDEDKDSVHAKELMDMTTADSKTKSDVSVRIGTPGTATVS